MFTNWITDQFLIEQIQHVLAFLRFDIENCQLLSTAYKFQSSLFVHYMQRKCKKWYSYTEKLSVFVGFALPICTDPTGCIAPYPETFTPQYLINPSNPGCLDKTLRVRLHCAFGLCCCCSEKWTMNGMIDMGPMPVDQDADAATDEMLLRDSITWSKGRLRRAKVMSMITGSKSIIITPSYSCHRPGGVATKRRQS